MAGLEIIIQNNDDIWIAEHKTRHLIFSITGLKRWIKRRLESMEICWWNQKHNYHIADFFASSAFSTSSRKSCRKSRPVCFSISSMVVI